MKQAPIPDGTIIGDFAYACDEDTALFVDLTSSDELIDCMIGDHRSGLITYRHVRRLRSGLHPKLSNRLPTRYRVSEIHEQSKYLPWTHS